MKTFAATQQLIEFRKLVRQLAFALRLFGFMQSRQNQSELLMATLGSIVERHSLPGHLLGFVQAASLLQQKGKPCVLTGRRRARKRKSMLSRLSALYNVVWHIDGNDAYKTGHGRQNNRKGPSVPGFPLLPLQGTLIRFFRSSAIALRERPVDRNTSVKTSAAISKINGDT